MNAFEYRLDKTYKQTNKQTSKKERKNETNKHGLNDNITQNTRSNRKIKILNLNTGFNAVCPKMTLTSHCARYRHSNVTSSQKLCFILICPTVSFLFVHVCFFYFQNFFQVVFRLIFSSIFPLCFFPLSVFFGCCFLLPSLFSFQFSFPLWFFSLPCFKKEFCYLLACFCLFSFLVFSFL